MRQIFFYIRHRQYAACLEGLVERLQSAGYEVWADWMRTECLEMEEAIKERLYVSDSAEQVGRLVKKGCFVLAYLHQDNRKEDFSSVLYAMENPEELDVDFLEKVYLRLRGLPWKILDTERCIVREITVEDVDSLYEIYRAPEITRYMENLYEDREQEKAYTKDYIEKMYGFYGYGIWVVVDRETGCVIGRAGLEQKTEGLELGYMISKPYQRKGYAFEVCQAILRFASGQLGYERVISQVQRDNLASVKLLEKLGFQRKYEEGCKEGGLDQYEILL